MWPAGASRADAIDRDGFAVGERLERAGALRAVDLHLHRLGGREHPAVAGARVIAVAVGDDGARYWHVRVDVEPAGLAPEALRDGHNQLSGLLRAMMLRGAGPAMGRVRAFANAQPRRGFDACSPRGGSTQACAAPCQAMMSGNS